MLEKSVINKKLNELDKNLALLNELKELSVDQLSDSLKEQWAVFYGLQISIQITIDIGSHILAALKENHIEEYSDIIYKLAKIRVIPEDFAKKIKGMPGLRNLLVHEYGIIDIEKIHDVLQNNLSDFEEFQTYIRKYINSINAVSESERFFKG
jgi:uncharacterized protein YutE (UPF0331/DUF86 family)